MEEGAFQEPTLRRESHSGLPTRPSRKGRFVVLVIFILLVVGLFFGVRSFLGSNKESSVTPSVTPTATPFAIPTDSPTPTPTATPQPTKTPTPKPVNPVDKTTGIDRSTLSVSVQNGNGEVGSGSKGSEALRAFGYHVVSIGNADNFDYEKTVIQVKEGKEKYLVLLQKDLSQTYTVGSTSASLSASSSADAVVIIGKQ